MFALKCLFQFEISCVKNDMPCASEKIIMAKVGGHESEHDVFHDVNSIYTRRTPWPGFNEKLSVFPVVKTLALFTVTSIHCIQKNTKKLWNRMEPKTESNRKLKKVSKRLKDRNRVDK